MANPEIKLPADTLEQALRHADLRVLVMVLFHLTGDKKWLSDDYRPKRDVAIISDENAGLSEEKQAELRAHALEILTSENCRVCVNDPGNELMQQLMSFCIGENVDSKYAPMMREMMGFTPRLPNVAEHNVSHDTAQALIVGAGQSGIAMAQALNAIGMDFKIFERNSELGGTWAVNKYPGCGVDTPNHSYSWSFARPYEWSNYFSKRSEIKEYIAATAGEFDLLPKITFNTEVISACWDETEQMWFVRAQTDGNQIEEIAVRFLISAVGQLNSPSIPDIMGIDKFGGEIFHSQQWPEDFNYQSRKLAIIGTGASAMQIVPEIASDVEQLMIFQRSAQWIRKIPRYSEAISDGHNWLFMNVPFYRAWYRFTMLWRYGDTLLKYLERDPDWTKADSVNIHNERHRKQMVAELEKALANHPDLIDKCTPNYPPYGKRILLDNGWYDAVSRRNVHLNTEGISEITERGVVDKRGTEFFCDAIILCTGFKVTEMASGLGVVGRNGVRLRDQWHQRDPSAYLGVHVAGFPNFFIMLGPNSSSGFGGSALFLSETQSHYIATCIHDLKLRGIKTIDVKKEVEERYTKKVDEAHEKLIWSHPGLDTYYKSGRGRVFSITPWPLVDYWHSTRKLEINCFDCQG